MQQRVGSAGCDLNLAIVAIKRGRLEEALREADQEAHPAWRAYAFALAKQAGSNRADADAALQAFVAGYSEGFPFQIASVYAFRGDADKAFEWLDHAWSVHDGGITELLSDPFLINLNKDPRFAAFCRKVGLPEPGA